jgi:hypothetical protein
MQFYSDALSRLLRKCVILYSLEAFGASRVLETCPRTVESALGNVKAWEIIGWAGSFSFQHSGVPHVAMYPSADVAMRFLTFRTFRDPNSSYESIRLKGAP